MEEQYKLEKGHTLTKYEKKYITAGFIMLFIAPFQFLLFYWFMSSLSIVVAVAPIAMIIIILIPSVAVHLLSLKIVFTVEERTEVLESLGIVRFPLFSMHAGIVLISRVIFLYIVRKATGNRRFRLNSPYIIRD